MNSEQKTGAQEAPFYPLDEVWDALTGQKYAKQLQTRNEVCSTSNQTLQEQAKKLQQQITDLQIKLTEAQKDNGSAAQIADLTAKLSSSQASLNSAQIQIGTLQDAVDTLQNQLAQTSEPIASAPDFLDQTKEPYLPFFQFFSPTGQMEGVPWKDPRDMYAPTHDMQDIVNKSGYEKMNRYDRLMLGWKYTIGYAYTADDGDNHQLPVQTRARRKGDCEDFARVVTTFWRLLKVSPDRAFNTTGSTSFGYHDWPIAYLSAEEIKGTPVEKHGPGWFIYEATLTYSPPCPMPLIGSSYHVVDGLENWAFKGKVKPEFGAQFQLSAGAPGGWANDNSSEKQKQIEFNKHWKNWHVKNGHMEG